MTRCIGAEPIREGASLQRSRAPGRGAGGRRPHKYYTTSSRRCIHQTGRRGVGACRRDSRLYARGRGSSLRRGVATAARAPRDGRAVDERRARGAEAADRGGGMMDALLLAFIIFSAQLLVIIAVAAVAEALGRVTDPRLRFTYWR